MKHVTDVYRAYQKYHGPEGPKEVPHRVRELVSDLQTKMTQLPEPQRADFQRQIDDIVSRAQEKDMNNKLGALGVQIGKAAAGMAGGTLLGPAGGVISGAVAQYYATEFENASKQESGVIKKAEMVAGRRRVKRQSPSKDKSPLAEAAKTAAKSTLTASAGGMGGIARSVWQSIKSFWGG